MQVDPRFPGVRLARLILLKLTDFQKGCQKDCRLRLTNVGGTLNIGYQSIVCRSTLHFRRCRGACQAGHSWSGGA